MSLDTVANDIKKRLPLREFIQNVTGRDFKGKKAHLCPFCEEKAFKISDKNLVFLCLSCHEGGDIISYVILARKCTYNKAKEFLLAYLVGVQAALKV